MGAPRDLPNQKAGSEFVQMITKSSLNELQIQLLLLHVKALQNGWM
jgi:hypothetical protein